MNDFIKEQTKNLNINNLSKEDLEETLRELFRYYSDIEMTSFYRLKGNHTRIYPGLGIEKTYLTGESEPINFEKHIKNIKKLSNKEKNELHNIYKDEECFARKFDIKAYFFDLTYSGDLYYLYELLFLKLFKHGYLNIRLFSFKRDKNTSEGKEFYAFMDKYIIKTNNFHSSETGKTEFNIKKIVEENYEKFIKLFLNSITIKGNEYDEYDFINRLDWEIIIPSLKTFLVKLNSLLSKYYEDNDFLKNEFINILNKSDNIIKIPYNIYFKEKILFFEYLKYLEDKNKLEIKKIYQEKIFGKPDSIVFEIEKLIFDFDILHLINFENKIKEKGSKQIIYKYEFKNKKLYINGKEFKIKKSEKTEYFIELINLYLSSIDNKKIPIGDLIDLYEKSTKDLKYLTLSPTNIKNSYITTIKKQLGEHYSNNEILKIEGSEVILI